MLTVCIILTQVLLVNRNKRLSLFNKISNNSPDEPAAVTGEVVAAEVVAAASATSVAERFGPATRVAKRAGSPTPETTSSVPDRHEVVEAVVEEVGVVVAAAAAADDQPAVAGSGSCHKVPAETNVTTVNILFTQP